MSLLLYIPWFQLELWEFSTPFAGHHEVLGWGFDVPFTWGIHPFGVLVALGVVIGAKLAERRGAALGIRPTVVGHCAAFVLIPAFVMAHVFDAIFYHPDVVLERPAFVLEIWNGLSSFGGFLGACMGALYWSHTRQVPLRLIADPLAYAFPFGWLFGRLGCFGVHDHPGRVTMFFLGVEDYQVGFPPWQVRHDLGLYEVLFCLAVIPLFLYLGRSPRPTGLFLALLPILYAPVRFGLDFLRATDVEMPDTRYFGLTPGHYSAILLLAAGLAVLVQIKKQPTLAMPARIALVPPPDAISGEGSPIGKGLVAEETDEVARAVGEEGPAERPLDAGGGEK